jgi:hypothetical protein
MNCPECGNPLTKQIVGRNPHRLTSVRWMCNNSECSVIFIENPEYGNPRIIKDPIMSKVEKKRSYAEK